jgi:hypothetical protein
MPEPDRTNILNVLNLYGFVLDAQRWELFDRVFTTDLHATFGPAGMSWDSLEGVLEHFIEFHRELDSHQHSMMGQIIHVDGDRANAFCYGTWMLRRDAVGENPTWTGSGWYDDELIRTDDGWRIFRRTARLVSWTGNPAVVGHNPDADWNLHVLKADVEAGGVAFFRAISGQ